MSGLPRQDVERAVHGDAPRVVAVVVDDVDLLRPAARHRVAVGHEGDLRLGHSLVLRESHHLVGGLMGEDPRVLGAPRVALAEHRLAGLDRVHPQLHRGLSSRHLRARHDEDARADALPVGEVRVLGVHGRDRVHEALGHELEQVLELEVRPQDLGDGPAHLATGLVAFARDAVRDGDALGAPADDDLGRRRRRDLGGARRAIERRRRQDGDERRDATESA
jgi:hypothetical protein